MSSASHWLARLGRSEHRVRKRWQLLKSRITNKAIKNNKKNELEKTGLISKDHDRESPQPTHSQIRIKAEQEFTN
jgi:hypothetical protein